MRSVPRARRRLGCLGGLAVLLLCVVGLFAILQPWSFHIGGRWTPTTTWYGVGRLRDSTGAEYGLYLSFFPDNTSDGEGGLPSGPMLSKDLRGKASVCTAGGAKYRFDVRGEITGAWLHTDGAKMFLSLGERPGSKIPRTFSLFGAWHGPELPLDDHKTMFMNFLPDGTLTPAGQYTAPVPEKHATVTLSWGSESGFETLCAELRGAPGR